PASTPAAKRCAASMTRSKPMPARSARRSRSHRKKTSAAFRRSKNFALVTPAPKTRIDLGLNLKGRAPTARLLAEKPGAMCTHKVGTGSLVDLGAELKGWLKAACDKA
ncbi:MAG: DUF5655 domain-containing protein, partial [Hyphomonas sp.]|uniref:DUF5655 domain-containing protein n=1 Tax=Hyphomonas sp. TaxID=87 RepID=UPI0034A0373A